MESVLDHTRFNGKRKWSFEGQQLDP